MSRRKFREEIVKRHIEIFVSDWEFLEQHFGRGSAAKIGAGPLIREIVHQKVKALRARYIDKIDRASEAQQEESVAWPTTTMEQ